MTRSVLLTTNFTSGELDPELYGRVDLRAYANGAAALRNAIVLPGGGAARRPGTVHVASVGGTVRLASLEAGPGRAYVLAFGNLQVTILSAGVQVAQLATPWTALQVEQLAWAQHGAGLLLCHQDVPPQRLVRHDEVTWSLAPWSFDEEDGAIRQPYEKFVERDVAIAANATTGTVTLTTSAPVFTAEHLGALVRIRRKEVLITNVQTPTQAVGFVRQELVDTVATTDWDEQAFSDARGWPVTLTLHQDRLVLGGSRDLPDRIWMSKVGRPFNFDLGIGEADEAIAFSLAADRAQAIRNLVSRRELQVFTDIGEWAVIGLPLTPQSVVAQQQTRIGSIVSRQVPPREVDGATLFAGRTGRELREFLYTDARQAYEAADLALLSRHLLRDPVAFELDPVRRLVLVVLADGDIAALALNRSADLAAWSLVQTDGDVLSLCVVDDDVMLLVKRQQGTAIERLTDTVAVDAGVVLTAETATALWSGFNHLEGQVVRAVSDAGTEDVTVVGGQITLAAPAQTLSAGLTFNHRIEALPAALTSSAGFRPDALYRPIKVTFRVNRTAFLRADTGFGLRTLVDADGDQPISGDATTRARGWRRGAGALPWRVEQDAAAACTILSVTTEVKVNA